MSIASLLTSGLELLENLAGTTDANGKRSAETFTWNDASVQCMATSITAGVELDIGGKTHTISYTLYVRAEHFLDIDNTIITIDGELYTIDNDTPRPMAGRSLTFRGQERRILMAKESASRSHYVLTIGSMHI